MSSVFSRIIAGDLPGTFVWADEDVVAFLSIAPLVPGHVLVVPRVEVDRWTDLAPETWLTVSDVAAHIGRAVRSAFDAPRAGVVVAGFEVPHTHVHVFPAWEMSDFDFSQAVMVDPAELAEPAAKIRAALRAAGHTDTVIGS